MTMFADAKASDLYKVADALKGFGEWVAIFCMTVLPLGALAIAVHYWLLTLETQFIVYFAICVPEIIGAGLLYKLWVNPARAQSKGGIALAVLGLGLMAYWPLYFLTVVCQEFLKPEEANLLYFVVGLPTIVGSIWYSATRASDSQLKKGAPSKH